MRVGLASGSARSRRPGAWAARHSPSAFNQCSACRDGSPETFVTKRAEVYHRAECVVHAATSATMGNMVPTR
jgi:hypothetical protein